ncbi:hypothetical protein CONPUDRAFT_163432 [Coniophora puteana RWD-64-598 SS2]|uniref:Uncharacterized protein n=1 Tax=Coniophora puteana (strain RWD-64-598) TaxID=741705 RepID=A0A5M3MYP8_CONPW|nr:uncharacterized protein CONPUDRAFT_163432 [Coniophora puteana RWD-64-598 SS2]EIW84260.1 hypothetical protein CONPUDRAFT_163432 [Coniophora puteana RWD-64-598 SS2]
MSSAYQSTFSAHTRRQLRFVFPGAALTYWLDAHHAFLAILSHGEGLWERTSAGSALALGALVVGLFLYVLLMPWIRGIEPNYRSWRESGTLSSVIPVLTGAILSGWSLLALTLGRWSNLGYVKGIVGASGMYALAFGLMGLLPAPRVRRN